MKVDLFPAGCIECGSCVIYCPDVFKRLPDNDKTYIYIAVDVVPKELEQDVKQAWACCPGRAIYLGE